MKKRISGTTAKGIPLINENNVADINQVNESLQKIDELLGDNQELNLHKNLSIIDENGVHNLKYDPITKSFYYNQGGEWLAVELEGTGNVSVSGLTAGVLKTGVTAIVKQGEKEIKRVTGTFTSDATATAGDIVSGRTAYVNGQKITGTLSGRPVISMSASVAFLRDGDANTDYVIRSLDTTLFGSERIRLTLKTGGSKRVYFRRGANLIIYGWGGFGMGSCFYPPWDLGYNYYDSPYTVTANVTASDYIDFQAAYSDYLPATMIICET